jgi:arsenite methyltransferase
LFWEAEMSESQTLRDCVRARYAEAASTVAGGGRGSCCSTPVVGGLPLVETAASDSGCCGPSALEVDGSFGAGLYDAADTKTLPAGALLASLGCGNPTAVADLHPGETVLDLGSGGGIDVLLSARRVGETGFAYGLDMTDEMLALARANATRAGAANVEFLRGEIEAIPLPEASVDVVISNCVINLSTDKPSVLAEMFRVLKPGGRVGVSDVVAEDQLTAADRAEWGTFIGCIAGALSRSEYLEGLRKVGLLTCRWNSPTRPRPACTVRSFARRSLRKGQAGQRLTAARASPLRGRNASVRG